MADTEYAERHGSISGYQVPDYSPKMTRSNTHPYRCWAINKAALTEGMSLSMVLFLPYPDFGFNITNWAALSPPTHDDERAGNSNSV